MTSLPDGVEAKHLALSFTWIENAGEELQERCFSRTVGADEAEYFTGGNVEIDVLDRPHAAEPTAETSGLDCGRDRYRFLLRAGLPCHTGLSR